MRAERVEQRERRYDLPPAPRRHGHSSGGPLSLRILGMTTIPLEGAGASATETVAPPPALLLPARAKATSRSRA